MATRANEVWSWDITNLRGPARGTFFYLYLIVDVWSRKIVGRNLRYEESAEHARDLVEQAIAAEEVDSGKLVVHADNGDVRDRAHLCLGFASGCRRSELVALDVQDLSFGDDGLELTIRRSKTDQEGLGRKVGIPPYGGRPRTCPVRAVRDWIDLSNLSEGPLFRPINRFGKILPSRLTGQSVALIVKRWALEAGVRPGAVRRPLPPLWTRGHSLRSGLATAAAKAGKSERSIMKQTGRRSVSVVRRYIRDAELFDDNAAAGIGL